MAEYRVEHEACADLLFSFRLICCLETSVQPRVTLLGEPVRMYADRNTADHVVLHGHIDVLDLVERKVLAQSAKVLPFTIHPDGRPESTFEVDIDEVVLAAKINDEICIDPSRTDDFFVGQDNLPLFIEVAQREKSAGRYDSALGILDFVLRRHSTHRVALVNKELTRSVQYVESVIAGNASAPVTMKTELLTVGLCLFDRPQEGRETLCNILFQSSKLAENVEVIVGDNGNNLPHIEDILEAFPQVIYDRRPFNVGVDQNMFSVYLRATGDFVYIIGDDDLLYEGSLGAILDVLKMPEADNLGLVYFVPNIIDPQLRSLALGNYSFTLSPNEDLTWVARDEIVGVVGVGFLRLSSLVYRKHAHVDAALQYLIGYYLFPLATALSSLNLGLCCAINKPLYAYRQQTTSTWAPKAHTIFYQWQPRLFYAMSKAGNLGTEAAAAVFKHLGIDWDLWRSLNDPDFILEAQAKAVKLDSAGSSYIALVKGGMLQTQADIDLLAATQVFALETCNLAHPSCFRIDSDGMMLHANESAELPSSCTLRNVPVSPDSNLLIGASLTPLARGPVTYRIVVREEADKPSVVETVSFDVDPGEKCRKSFQLNLRRNIYSITFSTHMTEPDRSCEFGWAVIMEAHLITSPSPL